MELTAADKEKVMKYIDMYGASYKDTPNLDLFIEDAAASVNPSYFGDRVHKAIAFLTLHNICVSRQLNVSAEGGVVRSKSIGPVSVTFAETSGKKLKGYNMSKYGLLFSDLIKQCGGGLSVTNNWRLL